MIARSGWLLLAQCHNPVRQADQATQKRNIVRRNPTAQFSKVESNDRHIYLTVFRYRLIENGFLGSKISQDFGETGPWSCPLLCQTLLRCLILFTIHLGEKLSNYGGGITRGKM